MSDEHAAALGEGYSQLAAGRAAAAERTATALLAKRPFDHAAWVLKVEAAAAGIPATRAVDVYADWSTRAQADDFGLLAAAARGILREAATDMRSTERVEALAALAEDGDDKAAETLRALRVSGDGPAALALAELGTTPDSGGISRALTVTSADARAQLLDELNRRHVAIPPAAVRPLLGDPLAETRAAAAIAAGQANATDLTPTLEGLLKDPDPQVRNAAALALRRLGSQAGSDIADALLNSEVPGVRLEALNALRDDPSVPVGALATPLLQDADPLVRVSAARLVAATDPASAQTVLLEAAGNENPAISGAAASALGQTPLRLPADSLVTLLKSPVGTVRVQAARAVLARARNAQPARGR